MNQTMTSMNQSKTMMTMKPWNDQPMATIEWCTANETKRQEPFFHVHKSFNSSQHLTWKSKFLSIISFFFFDSICFLSRFYWLYVNICLNKKKKYIQNLRQKWFFAPNFLTLNFFHLQILKFIGTCWPSGITAFDWNTSENLVPKSTK